MSEQTAKIMREVRAATGLNQTEFAKLVGSTQGTVSKWERGEEPRSVAVYNISTECGLSFNDLHKKLFQVD